MPDSTFSATLRLVWIALCGALISVGAYVPITIGPVPITLQSLFVMLAGFILGPLGGAAATGLYLLAGGLGLPVFSGGASGFAHFAGPTGGYLFGFLACAFTCGLLRTRHSADETGPIVTPMWLLFCFGLAGLTALYVPGLAWLKVSTGMDWGKTVSAGLLPFVPGALFKCALASLAYRYLARWKLLPL